MLRILHDEADLPDKFGRLADLLRSTIDADAVTFRLHDRSGRLRAVEALLLEPAATVFAASRGATNVLAGQFPSPVDSLEVQWEADGRELGRIQAQGSRHGRGFDFDDEWILHVAGELAGTALLRKLAASRTPRAFPLSSREEIVAALIARGYTNARIAGELTIARATVATHVAHILAKLQFRSRAQVAAWVARELTGIGPD